MEKEKIIEAVRTSACFEAEAAYLTKSGIHMAPQPRLFKELERGKVRVFFPTDARRIESGVTVALVCLYDLKDEINLYAHAVLAGSDVNPSLKSQFLPAMQAMPQPGFIGALAVVKFISWKEAAWAKFLTDELEMGTERASEIWLESFWKALDRMYGGGNLV